MTRKAVSLFLLLISGALLVGCERGESTYAKTYDEESGNVVSVALVNGKDANGYIVGNGRMDIQGQVISVENGDVKINGGEVMTVAKGSRVDVVSTKNSVTLTSGNQHVTKSM